MARPGITYHDVANAAQQLSAQGKNPTIESVRSLTGTGSSTTIAHHLKEWKNLQENTRLLCNKENLPEELVLTMKGLWERVINQADEKVTKIKQDYEQTMAELTAQHKKLEEENARWQQQNHQLKLDKDGLLGDKSALEQVVRQLQDEKITATAAHENLLQQLKEKQDRIDELHHLSQQAQANLEHYREASREQRIIDQQRHEQIQTQLDQTIQHLKRDLSTLNQQKTTLQNENLQTRYEKETLEKQCDQLLAQNGVIKSRLDEAQKKVIAHSHSEQHWQSQCQQLHTKLDEQNTTLLDLQTKIAVLTQKLSDTEDELKEMNEQNKHLAHEKWILVQEKAQIIGQLKQCEKLAV